MCNDPWYKKIDNGFRSIKVPIPCGGCMGCRIDSLSLWSARCNSEYVKYHSAFVTFTYDDYHLPYLTTESAFPSLCRDDLHCYIDNIRHKVRDLEFQDSRLNPKFSYFACGEYGDKFKRPHYHVLFFGLDYQYQKKFFIDSWSNGLIESDPILSGGVRYVCDYMTKNVNGELAEKLYDSTGRERPFYSVSRGLGSDLFIAHKDEISQTGCITIGSRVIPVPTYYKRMCYTGSSEDFRKRVKCNIESYDKIMRKAKKEGFSDYDSYVDYCRITNEISLQKRAIYDGAAPSRPYRSNFRRRSYSGNLALESLCE